MNRILFALGALLLGGWNVAPASHGGAPQRRFDSAGRLASEVRTGEGAYSHAYVYDLNDNRVSQITNPTLTGLDGRAFTFAAEPLPVEAIPLSGTWSVVNGKARAAGMDDVQLKLSLGANDLRTYTVKVKPDTSNLISPTPTPGQTAAGEIASLSRRGLYFQASLEKA